MGWFHRTVFLGHDIALFLPDPNWKWAVDVTHRLEVQVEEGKTGRENRTPEHEKIRHEVAATFTVAKDVARELEAALKNLGTAFVGIPLWPDARPADTWEDRVYDAEYVINYDETGFAIYAKVAVPEAPARAMLAPLLVGRLKARPRGKVRNLETKRVQMTIIERGPWDYVIEPVAVEVSPDWPAELVPNAVEDPEDWTEDMLEYRDVGRGRVEAVQGEEGITRRVQSALFTLKNGAELRTLLNFFKLRGGERGAFTMPWVFQPGADDEDTPHNTRVRFADGELTLSFVHGAKADANITFTQLPWEIAGVAGETPEQSACAYLYRFTIDVPGGPLVWRFTDWERDINRAEDGNYVTAPIQHDQIIQTHDLSDEAIKIMTWVFDGNPLLRYAKRRSEVPMTVEVFETDPATPAGARLVYVGEVGEIETRGRQMNASTEVIGGALEIKVPNFYFGKICNHEFCSVGCQLAPEDWTFAGTIQAQAGTEVTVLVTDNPPCAAIPDDYFARGWVKKGEGETYEVRQIVRSVDLGGGVQKFTLKRGFLVLGADEAATFRPTCTGTETECREKFGNYVNFGAHPRMGPKNISLPKQETAAPTAKK